MTPIALTRTDLAAYDVPSISSYDIILMKVDKRNGIMLSVVILFNFADTVCRIRKKVKNG